MKNSYLLWLIISISFFILFGCSSLRHSLYQSNALDLGWFDQTFYLISQGIEPIVSFSDNHILGDHAAIILYPLSLFYVVYPDLHWLLIIQSFALSITILPLWKLAKQANLSDNSSLIVVLIYLLYPLTFNVNLFDFHTEIIALPAIVWSILAAKLNFRLQFMFSIILILSCKAVLSLTVTGIGFWLFFNERKREYGIFALFTGIVWFILATQFIIPQFNNGEVAAVGRYSFLGNSVFSIVTNLFTNPKIIFDHIWNLPNLEYIFLLFIPIIWYLNLHHFNVLIPAIPSLLLNLLTDYQPQKDLIHQYSVPIIPFLLLLVITSMQYKKKIAIFTRYTLIWSLFSFLALAKYDFFISKYTKQMGSLSAMKEAIELIPPEVKVLTSPQFAPHLSHRSIIKLAINDQKPIDIDNFDNILLNMRYPGWRNSRYTIDDLVKELKNNLNFKLEYSHKDVVLFKNLSNSKI
ncbi:DUF2079 domain-containing protein [Candidatus Atelocyanobacterium thalassae]|uniref:DUF2079 domain-containing protein n=1 Tax=cyanobacterium endosymbiont of Braarudosphaera bigelowii TaxID=1285375 RepID=A0ABN6K288_9CHRO|nr:DUF2079 domain-containing protein [Candidatus Atelocyanobacterium thalassa]BDA39356.1 hypothetical protein CPARK_000019500 [cyanobacterium endosymbiont of Braarudosphaera bigelowii]